jgi:hypothetical protein
MSTHTIPGTSTEYHLIAFDADGRERTDDVAGGLFSRSVLEKVKAESPTNIFFFSHGWKGVRRRRSIQYNRWIKAMVDLTPDAQRMGAGFKPMWIGLHWPSLPGAKRGQGLRRRGRKAARSAIRGNARDFGGSEQSAGR